MIRVRILFYVLIFGPSVSALWAHPHMWIRGQMDPILGQKGLEAVHVVWNIDELTSSQLILEYDIDRDGTLSSKEVRNLKKNAFNHLIDAEYYLVVGVDDALAIPDKAENFNARIDNGHMIYDFEVPLRIPVRWNDLDKVRVFFFDRSYFIDFRSEDLKSTLVHYKNSEARFQKTYEHFETQGWGTVLLTGLKVSEVTLK